MTEPDHTVDWHGEIDLAPDAAALAMGTRALGDRPWLVVDQQRHAELALKAELCASHHRDVFAALDDTEAAGAVVEDMVRAALGNSKTDTDTDTGAPPAPSTAAHGNPAATGRITATPLGHAAPIEERLHPLDRAGRITQEDLCLLRRHDDGWHLVAGSVCFPSRWRLADKIGRHITAVHGPVDGYADRLAGRVDAMFDRLGERPVWRRNWFIHPDAALFQPTRPIGGDPIVPAHRALDDLLIRSERQTLRRLPDTAPGDLGHAAPRTITDVPRGDGGWLLFTIRVQQVTLATFCASPERRRSLAQWCRAVDPATRRHRGLDDDQAAELQSALDAV